jgi:hypothetical protein
MHLLSFESRERDMRIAELCPVIRRVERLLSLVQAGLELDDGVGRHAAAEPSWPQAGHVIPDAEP